MISPSKKNNAKIDRQLERICISQEFRSKKKLCQLLRFLVHESLAGRGKDLRGHKIGINVFDRDNDFDPDHDPIVRIQAGRLRRSLEVYYLSEGKNDPIKIVIHKGGYVPRFLSASESPGTSGLKIKNNNANKSSPFKPSIAVLPFKNLTGDPGKDYFVQGFSEEISIELTQYEELMVISCQVTPSTEGLFQDNRNFSEKFGVHFLLEGSVRLDDERATILIKLTDARNNEQVWAERYRRDLSANNFIKIQEEIALITARLLASEYGIILQRLSIASMGRKPNDLETYEAILRFYYYETHFSPEASLEAFRALTHALQKEPNSGIVAALLAVLYGHAYMLDIANNSGALEKMSALAEKALKLDPNSLRVRIIHAWKSFVCNEKEKFLEEIEKCLAMNLNSPLKMGSIGFHLSLYGEWERGKSLLDKAMHYNIGFPLFLYGATTLYHYRKNDYTKALQEARNYNIPTLFWGPMLRAAVLGQLGHQAEAQPEIRHLKTLKPDFESKAHYLISRFVKEQLLVAHIIEGLQKAGLEIINTKS